MMFTAQESLKYLLRFSVVVYVPVLFRWAKTDNDNYIESPTLIVPFTSRYKMTWN